MSSPTSDVPESLRKLKQLPKIVVPVSKLNAVDIASLNKNILKTHTNQAKNASQDILLKSLTQPAIKVISGQVKSEQTVTSIQPRPTKTTSTDQSTKLTPHMKLTAPNKIVIGVKGDDTKEKKPPPRHDGFQILDIQVLKPGNSPNIDEGKNQLQSVPGKIVTEMKEQFNPANCGSQYSRIEVVNQYNEYDRTLRTSAKIIFKTGHISRRSSDAIVNLIGQENYSVLYAALCSLHKDLREKAILSLLTVTKYSRNAPKTGAQVELSDLQRVVKVDKAVMTDLSNPINHCKKKRMLKTRRRPPQPYAVSGIETETDKNNHDTRLLLKRDNLDSKTALSYSSTFQGIVQQEYNKSQPSSTIGASSSKDQSVIDNLSDSGDRNVETASFANLSITTSIWNNHEEYAHKLVDRLTKHDDELLNLIPENDTINSANKGSNDFGPTTKLADGGFILPDVINSDDFVLATPSGIHRNNDFMDQKGDEASNDTQDIFHMATPERLKALNKGEKAKLIQLQMYMDWKYCEESDEDGNLPIHNAVLNNDIDLLKRHVFVLKAKTLSVDMGDSTSNSSALQVGIWNASSMECVKFLLEMGADPLHCDQEERTCLHLCAEQENVEYLQTVVQHMAQYPRKCLEAADLWKPEYEDYKNDKLTDLLITHAMNIFDDNGYSPVMVAARHGRDEHVYCMLEFIHDTHSVVNTRMPTSGNTALYLSAEAALIEAQRRCDLSAVPDNHVKTMNQLIRHGATPYIENFAGHSVHLFASEVKNLPLINVISEALALSKLRHPDMKLACQFEPIPDLSPKNSVEPLILIKSLNGTYNYEIPKRTIRSELSKINANADKDNPIEVRKIVCPGKKLCNTKKIISPQNFENNASRQFKVVSKDIHNAKKIYTVCSKYPIGGNNQKNVKMLHNIPMNLNKNVATFKFTNGTINKIDMAQNAMETHVSEKKSNERDTPEYNFALSKITDNVKYVTVEKRKPIIVLKKDISQAIKNGPQLSNMKSAIQKINKIKNCLTDIKNSQEQIVSASVSKGSVPKFTVIKTKEHIKSLKSSEKVSQEFSDRQLCNEDAVTIKPSTSGTMENFKTKNTLKAGSGGSSLTVNINTIYQNIIKQKEADSTFIKTQTKEAQKTNSDLIKNVNKTNVNMFKGIKNEDSSKHVDTPEYMIVTADKEINTDNNTNSSKQGDMSIIVTADKKEKKKDNNTNSSIPGDMSASMIINLDKKENNKDNVNKANETCGETNVSEGNKFAGFDETLENNTSSDNFLLAAKRKMHDLLNDNSSKKNKKY